MNIADPDLWGIHAGKAGKDCATTMKLYERLHFEKSALMVWREQLRQMTISSAFFLNDRLRS